MTVEKALSQPVSYPGGASWPLRWNGQPMFLLDPDKTGGESSGSSAGNQSEHKSDGKNDDKKEEEKKSFTQSELDYLFRERTKNVKDKTVAEILAELGVDNIEAAKEIIAKKKEADEAAKSELQKAQDKATQAETELAKIKAEQEKVLAKARESLMKAEVLRHVISFKDANGNTFRPEAIDDVWLLIDKTKIEEGEKEGEFKGIKEAVEQVAKDRPHWLIDNKTHSNPRGTPRSSGEKSTENKQMNNNQTKTRKRPFTL